MQGPVEPLAVGGEDGFRLAVQNPGRFHLPLASSSGWVEQAGLLHFSRPFSKSFSALEILAAGRCGTGYASGAGVMGRIQAETLAKPVPPNAKLPASNQERKRRHSFRLFSLAQAFTPVG